MKKTKVIIPALGLLLLSTAASVTGTVAWFSMNTTVSATGMQVAAKSKNTFLLIGTGENDTAGEIQTGALTTVGLSVTAEQSQVFPSSPILSSYVSDTAETNAANHKYFASGTTVVSNAATAAAVANWFTAQNNDPSSSNNSVKNVHALEADTQEGTGSYEFSKYVIKRTVYLTLAVGSDAAHNLSVSATFASLSQAQGADITAVRALVATGDNYAILSSSSASGSLHTTDFAITSSGSVTVDIYLYYDGEASVVYTNNAANLVGASANFDFSVEVGSVA